MINSPIIKWLLEGDVSIQYQVYRDLLDTERPDLKERIAKEGWGAKFMTCRNKNGHWGLKFYQPKWTSTHYTLQDLRNLNFPNSNKEIALTIQLIFDENLGNDGGINPSLNYGKSDVCINGMFLNYASYFGTNENQLKTIVDYILGEQLPDGGFNCEYRRIATTHSSLHSTISVIEGIQEYRKQGYKYKLDELKKVEEESREFILVHKLFRSHRTGEIIDKRMTMLSYPYRWHYDILRALDYFRNAGVAYDSRMADALEIIAGKQRKDNKWPLQNKWSGNFHFEMESTATPSRWNTLRALRVLKNFGKIDKIG
jgi:hypothetical protein